MYAIVDIEGTGSPAAKNGITEIAIVLYDGKKIVKQYETLVNPKIPIPKYVAKLTGISDAMVSVAPTFDKVAPEIFKLLKNTTFVAHNAGFDFPYLKYFLTEAGYELDIPVLCTLQLSRKAFPNLIKHGLESICEDLKITLDNRHRAGGDALATTRLLDMIIKNGGKKLVESMTGAEYC
ncbi:MAG TPA: 3'-5' exonuclease [Arachidicoccus sp.]|nr:3'-5' exonuclease [Arachidicoccus sp.]